MFYQTTQSSKLDSFLYEPEHDNGMQIQKGLDYLHQHGGPNDVTAIAFASVDVNNLESIHAALATFGSLWLDVNVLESSSKEHYKGKP